MSKNFNSIFIYVVTGIFTGIAIYGVVENNRGLDFLLINILIPWLIIYIVFSKLNKSKDKKE